MDDFLTKYWHLIVGSAAAVAAYGEARLKLGVLWKWMQRKTDPELVRERTAVEEKLAAAVEQLARAVDRLDGRVETLTDKYEANTRRVWESIDSTNQRLARMEGRHGTGATP